MVKTMTPSLRKHVEMVSNFVTRHVRVDRSLTPAQAIEATGRVRGYVDEQVLTDIPTEGRDEDDQVVFELGYDPTVDELDREYEDRGLCPDPMGTTKLMADDPAFADERSLVVQWRDSKGRACYAIFGRWPGERLVGVNRSDYGWSRSSRFAGVRK
jgi:hypothetical protein